MQYVDCCGWAIDMLAATPAAAICDLLRPGRFFRTEGEKRGGMCKIRSIRIRLAMVCHVCWPRESVGTR
jgi:hypothetical protein